MDIAADGLPVLLTEKKGGGGNPTALQVLIGLQRGQYLVSGVDEACGRVLGHMLARLCLERVDKGQERVLRRMDVAPLK